MFHSIHKAASSMVYMTLPNLSLAPRWVNERVTKRKKIQQPIEPMRALILTWSSFFKREKGWSVDSLLMKSNEYSTLRMRFKNVWNLVFSISNESCSGRVHFQGTLLVRRVIGQLMSAKFLSHLWVMPIVPKKHVTNSDFRVWRIAWFALDEKEWPEDCRVCYVWHSRP